MMLCDLDLSVSDYVPEKISYEDAVNKGREGIAVWGDEYLEVFDEIITSPHIDVYPAEKKQGGAYEYLLGNETTPFVNYNYDGLESYISTIVHEMGHGVYSELSAENQNIYNCTPDIFTQEVASTANEIMFHKYMIENADSEEEKLYWLDKEINLFLNTIMIQSLFSEFEDYCYKTIEEGGALSADALSEKMLELCKLYYGDAFTISDDTGINWARIPHFYNNYYVYQYATSNTYSASICEMVEENGQEASDDYLEFLKAGKTADPVSLLSIAGVDPLNDDTYEAAADLIGDLIDEFIETSCADETDKKLEAESGENDRDTMFQVSLLQGLTLGDYEGSVSVADLKEKGDIGIGTFDGLNGEMIVLDGTVYRADGEGKVEEVEDEELIPFSNVTFFDEDEKETLEGIDSIALLQKELDKKVEELGKNRFYVVRIDGTFPEMNVRSEYAQEKPYKPLAKVLETDQTFFDYEDIEGTVVAIYCPAYMSNMNASGWHMHFISKDRSKGGHVLGLKLKDAEALYDVTDKFELELPNSEMFSDFDLTIDQSEDIEKVEKKTE
nr:acetolactate decarboxylase [Lachnospiraceae bacterium]